METLEAAGRQLSSKNLDQLKAAWNSLTTLLLDSGNLTPADFPASLIDAQGLYDKQKKAIQASGSEWLENVEREAWFHKFEHLLQAFRWMFIESLQSQPKSESSDLLSDFTGALERMAKELPAPEKSGSPRHFPVALSEQDEEVNEDVSEEPEVGTELDEEAETEETEEIEDAETSDELPSLETEEIEEVLETEAETETLELDPIQASDAEGAEVIHLEIAASARGPVSAASNERYIEGVLFKVGQPSEAIPGVGPGLPLYIPRYVAEEAIACLAKERPKPLDAHDSLTKHANKEIVGAMHSARIEASDFVVSGVLWDWSQPEKVLAISCARDDLGMSVNATADGHPSQIDGTNVWQVDKLRILGANILFSKNATFKQTRLLNANAAEEEELILAAASSVDEQPPLPTQESTMDSSFFLDQLTEISAGIAQIQSEVQRRFAELEPTVNSLQLQLSEIQDERINYYNEIQASAEAEAQEINHSTLLNEISSLIDQKLQASSRRPGSGIRPASQVLPLAASSAPTAGANPIVLQLASVDGELRGLEADPTNIHFERICELRDLKQSLQSQLHGH